MLSRAPKSIRLIPQRQQKNVEIIDPNAGKPINLLVLGQDSRDGANQALGATSPDDGGEHNADTTMVVQISADRSYINIVSIPRDSLVDAPSCTTTHGTVPARYNVMFNSIFASGWQTGGDLASAASCTANAVNSLTGLDIQQFVVVDFNGLKNMIDAIGGVDLCIPVDIQDDYTSLDIKRGMNHMDGITATTYARMRHGTGTDGSDIMRTTRQQYLVKELISEALSKNLMTNNMQLYRLANSALESLTISEGMSKANVLAGLAMSLKNIHVDHVYTRTIPVVPAPSDPSSRVIWSTGATEVWKKLRNNEPLTDEQIGGAAKSAPESSQSNTDSGTQNSTPAAPSAPAAPAEPAPDPNTGLIKRADGTLIDPVTGGTVDPQDGSIRDANTGQYIGIANRYLMTTVCGVPAKNR
ncbi:LCP family protein [Bifidobacterium bombi]|nr:LCP family protein [Bifidobacterium bombi]